MQVNHHVRNLRRHMGWTQKAMASHLGVTYSSVCQLEKHPHPPGPHTLAALADIARRQHMAEETEAFDALLLARHGLFSPGRAAEAAAAAKATPEKL